ncbi:MULTISPECIES: 4-hydroxy-tetrahydrodipicolinate synthase [Brevibacillus]|uniref:4-hydroxy-tetrahydrodipicolinate synthase n=1 Tax=Brevibacillus borstelensis AK1 TaxID=1300222 RepID=M8EFA8_9BACL|nr:4-hydroxy-tetrahydrodipicolinate synthase [Brevibacillus borstelensis]EMT54130.1 dihydrodipicolinate synthase [Brevibacillus borstelensis AK1]MBE5397979.1 4-hydroxy-tetrahydrodipicolinate synthase [Brevibacillus borstelensis]MCC0563506.1 4-hydroxy-tetrahydrodipicolinate synthase [Brevibacillus borstelensis]MCM3469685.1 4-hydroxy-tetrahydrodipicolinate synthase [Brevibacillus borstelensis]MCM3557887.1 4-hydroxy-tetrahydrodipicolinate synthase [Brevibacillus borstelensis]
MARFGRLVTAMVTPFNQQLEIDYEQTERLIDHLLATGTDAVVVSGTTGESPTLSAREKLDLFKHVVSYAKGKCHIIAGTGSNNTAASIEFTKEVEKIGVDAVMLVTPYYSRPSQEGIYQHFKALAESTKLPVMLYNVPGRTSVNMTAETTLRLAQLPNVVCVKEASGNLSQMASIIEHAPEGFELYSGDDGLTLPVLSIGGVGIVSVASHVVGAQMSEMMSAFFRGEHAQAAAIHRKLLPVFEGLFAYPSPGPVKAALEKLGVQTGGVRLPLVDLTEEEKAFVHSLLG